MHYCPERLQRSNKTKGNGLIDDWVSTFVYKFSFKQKHSANCRLSSRMNSKKVVHPHSEGALVSTCWSGLYLYPMSQHKDNCMSPACILCACVCESVGVTAGIKWNCSMCAVYVHTSIVLCLFSCSVLSFVICVMSLPVSHMLQCVYPCRDPLRVCLSRRLQGPLWLASWPSPRMTSGGPSKWQRRRVVHTCVQ